MTTVLKRRGTGTSAYCRTNATASRWLCTISPKLTKASRRWSSITVLSASAPPSMRTIASCSSCSGLPSSTQLAARGWDMNSLLWKVVIVSAWATPGAITFRPPDQPAMKCGSTSPVAILRSASTSRRSSRTTVPRGVRPRWTWSASSRARWLTTRTCPITQGSPTSSASSAPSFGRCSPVATRMVMPSRGTPASSSVRTRAGRNRPFGTGRVMSQIRMQAERFPRASLLSGGASTGTASAASIAAIGSGSSGMACLAMMVGTQPAGGVTASRPRS